MGLGGRTKRPVNCYELTIRTSALRPPAVFVKLFAAKKFQIDSTRIIYASHINPIKKPILLSLRFSGLPDLKIAV